MKSVRKSAPKAAPLAKSQVQESEGPGKTAKLDAKTQKDQMSGEAVRAGGLAPSAPSAPKPKLELASARFEEIEKIPARYAIPSGPKAEFLNKALDATISSMLFRMGAPMDNPEAQAQALLYVAHDTIDRQQALIDGTAKSLENKSPSETKELQELSRSLLGTLSDRLFSTFERGTLVRVMPEQAALLLAPNGETQTTALAVQVRIEAERHELTSVLRSIESAVQVGMKIDQAEGMMFGAAKKGLESEPGPALEAIMPLADRAKKYMDEVESKRRAMDSVRAQSGAVGQTPAPLSEEAIAAQVKANMAKVELRLAELRASVANAPNPNMLERFEGAMLGTAVADCLGSTTEFMAREDIRFRVGMNVDLVGGGAFGWKPGEPTDDTQMALAMARSIVAKGGFDQADVGKNFVGWYDTKPKDIGGLTRNTLGYIKHGVEPDVAGFAPWAFGGFDNAGNGSVMRAVPVALLTAFVDDAELIRIAHASSSMTHADPRCTWGTAAMCKGMQLVLAGESNVTAKVAKWLENKNPSLAKALADVPKLNPEDVKTTGFVVDTVQAAFYALERFDNYVDAAAFLTNHGEDTDTAGATGGMLLGAKFGVKAIPEAWSAKVIGKDELQSLAQKIHGLATV